MSVLVILCFSSIFLFLTSYNPLAAYFIPQPAHRAVSFPKVRPHAPNTIQTPARSELSFIGKVKQSIWFLGARLQEQDLKYAFKAGMATAVLAAPAFFDATRPTFVQYRGEWALISVRPPVYVYSERCR